MKLAAEDHEDRHEEERNQHEEQRRHIEPAREIFCRVSCRIRKHCMSLEWDIPKDGCPLAGGQAT